MAARSHWRRTSRRRSLAILSGWGVVVLLLGSSASAQPNVTVRVTIEKVSTLIEHCDPATAFPECDFFTRVSIDGTQFESDTIDDDNTIEPDWRYSKTVPVSAGSVPISIQMWDSDFIGDQHIDITHGEGGSGPGGGQGKDVKLTVNLVPCTIQSESLLRESSAPPTDPWSYTADCNKTLLTESYTGGRTVVWFKVEVIEPPYGASLGVRCLHSPVWPNKNQTVRVTAEAVTFPANGNLQTRISDSVEIWVDDEPQPRKVASGTGAVLDVGPLTNSSFSYRCRVEDDGMARSTGWRRVAVGPDVAQLYGGPAPVFYNGSRKASLDVLFHPDRKAYSGAQNAAFMSDVYRIVWNSLLAREVFLENQLNYNLWIGSEFGDYRQEQPGVPQSNCVGDAPPHRAWADMTVTLHKVACRDNELRSSKGNAATTEVTDPSSEKVFLHEASHALFGLADEYCCDGGYFSAWPYPNVYDFESFCRRDARDDYPWANHDLPGASDCVKDALKIGRTGACRSWTDVDSKTRWTSDPASNDVMVDRGRAQRLDERRIEWISCNCTHGQC